MINYENNRIIDFDSSICNYTVSIRQTPSCKCHKVFSGIIYFSTSRQIRGQKKRHRNFFR